MALRSPKSSTQSPALSVSVDDTDSAPEEIESRLAQISPPVIEFEDTEGTAAAEDTPIPEAQKKSPRENAEGSEKLAGSAVSTYSQEITKAAG